jgi:hypothetical protein
MAGGSFVEIDTGALDALRRGFEPASQRGLLSAFKAEAYRLKKVVEDRLRSGVGPSPAPLSRAEQKTKSAAALSEFGRFIAYVVEQRSYDIEARIGLSKAITRAKNAEGRRRQIVALLEGGSHPITREDQRRIAAKLRRRLSQGFAPVLRRMGYSAGQARKLSGRGARSGDIGAFLPKVGSTLVWPERNVVAQTVAAECERSVANVARLYAMALRGERWAKDWYKPVPPSTGSGSLSGLNAFVEGLFVKGGQL